MGSIWKYLSFSPTTHPKTNVSMIFAYYATFIAHPYLHAQTAADAGDYHLTNLGYFDYKKNLNTPV